MGSVRTFSVCYLELISGPHLRDYSRSEARTCLQMEWKEMGWDVEVTAVVTAKRPSLGSLLSGNKSTETGLATRNATEPQSQVAGTR